MKSTTTNTKRAQKIAIRIMSAICMDGCFIIPENASEEMLDVIEILNDRDLVKFQDHEEDVLVGGGK